MTTGMKEFVEKYAQARGVNKTQAKKEVQTFLDVFTDSIYEGGVSFMGMFSAKKVLKPERSGSCNGKAYTTPAHNTVKFSVSKKFEEIMNK